MDSIDDIYEKLRQRFEMFARENELASSIEHFILLQQQNEEFNHLPHISHISADTAGLIFKNFGADVDIVHSSLDYFFAYQEHQNQAEIKQARVALSQKTLATIELLGLPNDYSQALAQQKLLSKLNLSFLDPVHFEQFKQRQNQINNKVIQFSQQQQNKQYQDIFEQNQQQYQQQIQALNAIKQIYGMTQNNNRLISDNNAENKQQVKLIIQRLHQLGISTENHLASIFAQNDFALSKLEVIVDYLEHQQLEKLNQQGQQYKTEQFKGVNDACQLVLTVASYTQSKPLMIAATVAQSSNCVTQAIDFILQGGMSSLGMLTPLSAIGMAVFQVFSLLRRNKNPDVQQLILKNIAQLSRQIHHLHGELQQTKKEILYRIDYYFSSLFKALEHINQTFHVTVLRQLTDISSDLQTLFELTKAGFNEVLLKDLKDSLMYLRDIEQGIKPLEDVKQSIFEKHLRVFSNFALRQSGNELFTGGFYAYLLKDIKNVDSINKTLICTNRRKIMSLLGLVLCHGQQQLNISKLQAIENKLVVNPEIWLLAVKSYLDLQIKFYTIYEYDPKRVNHEAFLRQADHMILYVNVLQQEENIYIKLIDNISQYYLRAVKKIELALANFIQLHHYHPNSDNINIFDDKKFTIPQSPKYQEYVIPKVLKAKSKEANYFSLQSINNKLNQLGIKIPQVCLIAEKLGIGQLEYRFHPPQDLKHNHHKSEKHKHKYTLKPGQMGFEINFYFEGRCIPLYKASYINNKHHFGNLNETYNAIIKQGTQAFYNEEALNQIKYVIENRVIKDKKFLCREIYNESYDDIQNCLTQCYWLHNYLSIAGFPEDVLTHVEKIITKLKSMEAFKSYAESSQRNIDFPLAPHFDQHEINDLKKMILDLINQESVVSVFNSDVKNLFELGKQYIYEGQVILSLKKERALSPTHSQSSMFVASSSNQHHQDTRILNNRFVF